MMATPPAIRVWGSAWAFYKRVWVSNAVGSILQPFLYLLGMGVGVGTLVDQRSGAADTLGGATYFEFLAPGLIATAAMMTSAGESMWALMDGFSWGNRFRAMTATPLRPVDVLAGTALWTATRVVISSGAVAVVLVLFDDTRTWGLLAAVAFAVLTGLAFAMPLSAWTSTREREISFPAIMRFGIVPMFLFAGSFFPVDQLPEWLRVVAWATPLYHGVELCRGVVLGSLGAVAAVVHVGVLAVFATVGTLIAARTFRTRLQK